MKIAELVKTYRLLNDPDAPDWNVKFVGALAIATMLLAGAGALLAAEDSRSHASAPAALSQPSEDAAPAPEECDPARFDREPDLEAICAAATAPAQAP